MTYKLRIEFAGLCLFAPRTTGSVSQVHVLMPNVLGTNHCAERHVPVLRFDTAHLRPGSTQPDGLYAQALLSNREWVIGGDSASTQICSQIADLWPVTQGRVLPQLLDPQPGPLLASRVTLGRGAMAEVARGACWEWDPNVPRRLSHRARWVIPDVVGDALNITLMPLGTAQVFSLPSLYPVLAGSDLIIHLYVEHMTPDDLAPDTAPTRQVPVPWHFEAYYPLFGPQTPIRLPRARPDAECSLTGGDCPEWIQSGESAFNCMLATGG
jgi:hypothetical protein